LVDGELRTRSYEKDGETRRVTEVVIYTLDFLTPKPSEMASEEHIAEGDEPSS